MGASLSNISDISSDCSFSSLPTMATSSAIVGHSLFAEYIGAEWNGVKFSDVKISSAVDFHFILAFAVDYTDTEPPRPNDGHFNVFWHNDSHTPLTPQAVLAIKKKHNNVKVSVSLGGDTVGTEPAYFNPSSADAWILNAVKSLTKIIKDYHLDGIDINFEHFSNHANRDMFVECMGQLITTLKRNRTISFASIAPEDSNQVQRYYQELWHRYGKVIDYITFKFHGCSRGITVTEFVGYFEKQMSNYSGSRLLACFGTFQGSGGLSPENGFFDACRTLMKQGKLGGIFVWCADSSKEKGKCFKDEIEAQELLANSQPQQMSASSTSAALSDRGLFVEYIDAQRSCFRVSSADYYINPELDFHFILASAIDADRDTLRPTNGRFSIFWQNNRLFPRWIETIKQKHDNVKVAVSLGNNTVGPKPANFNPYTSYSWTDNAIRSLTGIIREYNLDGIDINYQHFSENVHQDMFTDCIGQVITTLKRDGLISFASIAPSENETVEKYYRALWEKHNSVIDYINFQFHADSWNIGQFIESFNSQITKYQGGRILASLNSEKNLDKFLDGCRTLKSNGVLGGISFWSEDSSSRAKNSTFDHGKKQAQELVASTAH